MNVDEKEIAAQIQFVEDQISKLPDGKLVCTKNRNRYKWYHSLKGKLEYIPKRNRQFAEQLALKKYLELRLDELLRQSSIIKLLEKTQVKMKATELLQHDGYKDLLRNHFESTDEKIQKWIKEEYQGNPFHSEKLIHETASGIMVRSKSEAKIADALYYRKIPFRYEAPLMLEGTVYYPDFTILHPQTAKIFYWEHLGMMDDKNYRSAAFQKLALYGDHEIYPDSNLILTYETLAEPLSSYHVQMLIENFFL